MNLFLEIPYHHLASWFNQALWEYNGIMITPFNLIRFIVFICLSIYFAGLCLRGINQVANKRQPAQSFAMYRLARVVYYVVLISGLLIAISSLGVDFSHLALIAGALSLGLGFGLQNVFNNFFSGIILLFEDQLKLGDFIKLEEGIQGEILELNFRTITLRTLEKTVIFVPNSFLIGKAVSLKWTVKAPYHCLQIPFSIKSKGVDLRQIDQVLLEEIKKLSFVIQNGEEVKPSLYFKQLGEQRASFELRVWVDGRGKSLEMASQCFYMIKQVLDRLGIESANEGS